MLSICARGSGSVSKCCRPQISVLLAVMLIYLYERPWHASTALLIRICRMLRTTGLLLSNLQLHRPAVGLALAVRPTALAVLPSIF